MRWEFEQFPLHSTNPQHYSTCPHSLFPYKHNLAQHIQMIRCWLFLEAINTRTDTGWCADTPVFLVPSLLFSYNSEHFRVRTFTGVRDTVRVKVLVRWITSSSSRWYHVPSCPPPQTLCRSPARRQYRVVSGRGFIVKMSAKPKWQNMSKVKDNFIP